MVNPQWYGAGFDYRGTPDNSDPVQYWQNSIIPKLLQWHFSTVRITFGSNSYHSDLDFNVLGQVLAVLSDNGIKAVLCCMNNPYRAEMRYFFGSDEWLNLWESIAQRFRNDDRIVAYEIFNEPFPNFWNPRVTNKWEVGYYNGICYDRIRSQGDNHTIVFCDPQFFMDNQLNVGGWMSGETYRDAVITFHCWASNQAANDWHIQRMNAWVARLPIWIGETGVRQDTPTPPDYCLQILNYAVDNQIGFNIWMVGYPGGQTAAWELYEPILSQSNYATKYSLVISVSAGGTTDPVPGSYLYDENSVVQVSAIPSSGYLFDRWELDGVNVGGVTPVNVTMDNDHALTAYFAVVPPPPPGKHNLTISATVGGTTNPEPGAWEYEEGTFASVTAIPSDGYVFDHWELDGQVVTANPISILMDADHSVLAVFKQQVVTAGISPWLIGVLFSLPLIYLVTRKRGT